MIEDMLSQRADGPRIGLPSPATLPALIDAQARRTPNATALEDNGQALDYRGLARRVEDLAHILRASGVQRGDVVGVVAHRDVATVVALIATQRAGAAFLPLDPTYPSERVAFMLSDAGSRLVLSSGPTPIEARVLRLDALPEASPTGLIPEPPGEDDIAYVMYTSGSTGNPKGVEVSQRAIANLALWGAQTLGPAACLGMLFTTALVFDVAMFEIFSPLVCGGRVLIVDGLTTWIPERLRRLARVVSTSPTVLDAALRAGALPGSTTCVVTAGEALSREFAERLLTERPNIRLVNAYGPTEATVYASFAEVVRGETGEPSIGRALTNMSLYILDRNGRLLPEGAEGELCIGGAGVARGYVNRPELTRDRFTPNPFGPGNIYWTGDRARWRNDGQVEFLGRLDGQFKLHGVRIEAGEVRAALLRQPEIAAAAVGLRGTASSKTLVAWLIERSPAPSAAILRRRLANTLPSPMIPSAFVIVPEFPVTLSGKLDLAALPDPAMAMAGDLSTRRPPATPSERDIFALWREVIDIPAIRAGDFGVDDDLFDLGADSLSAVRLNMEIGVRHGLSIPAGLAEGGMTVAVLAATLDKLLAERATFAVSFSLVEGPTSSDFALIRSARGAARGAVIAMPGFDGSVTVAGVIAGNALENHDVWAFPIKADDRDLRVGLAALEAARSLADRLAAGHDFRPAAFIGFSFGGFLAWLVDRLLVAKGFPPTPIVNIEGYVYASPDAVWREPLRDLAHSANPGARTRMLLLQRRSPAHYTLGNPCEADWTGLGVIPDIVECRSLDHLDLETPAAIRAASGLISRFVEAPYRDLTRRELAHDFDTFGGRLFRLADSALPPNGHALGDLLDDSRFVPEDGAIWHALHALSGGAGDPELNLRVARYAAERHPNHAPIRMRLGDALANLGDFDGAERAYRRAIEIDPTRASGRDALASLLDRQGQRQPAG